jgi:3-oxoadipate enol-lactonase
MPAMALHSAASGSGPGVVLLHPVGLDHSFWGGLIERLAASYRVLALDLRGHGRSGSAAKGMQVAEYADDVAQAIEAHGVGPAAVVGLSFGGMIAQTLAVRSPSLVSALVACGCPPGLPAEAQATIRERGLAAERGGMAAVVDATIERWFTPAFRETPVAARVREHLLQDTVQGWSAGWHAIAGFDLRAELWKVRCPTLVVAGELDAATPAAASAAIAAGIQGATLVTLAEAPHMMQLETSAAFSAAMADFLARCRQG